MSLLDFSTDNNHVILLYKELISIVQITNTEYM